MNEKLKRYLDSIGLKGELFVKVENAYRFFTEYLECEIEDIFVSEYINKEGVREYENIWFFNDDYCYEAKHFIMQEDFDSCVIKNNIDYFSIKKSNFDIISNLTADNSRMNLEFRLKNSMVVGDMKASKSNCEQLAIIVKKYFKLTQVI